MAELVKINSFWKLICNYLLEIGLQIPTSPLEGCKLVLQQIKDKREDQFINDVLEGVKKIDSSDLNAEKSLSRLYKTLQVIAKATTQDKINRFKKLTINGIIYQKETSENEYELFLNILDSLTEEEFVILLDIFKNKGINSQNQEIVCYLQMLNSKGLIKLEPSLNGNMVFKDISIIGKKFMEFINREGN